MPLTPGKFYLLNNDTYIYVAARVLSKFHGDAYIFETLGSKFLEPWNVKLVESFICMYKEISEADWDAKYRELYGQNEQS